MAESPFISGFQFAWNSTSLGWFKDCPRKYQLSMLEGWRLSYESHHLTFGRLYHSALERYDKLRFSGIDHDSATRSVVEWLTTERWESPDSKKNPSTLIRSVVWYLEHYRDDPQKTYRLADGTPAVELSFRMELDYGPVEGQNYILAGHLDRIVEFNNDLYISDRKTTGSSLGASYYSQFNPDNQMSLYTIAAEVVFATPVKGIIIDAAQIQVGGTTFGRGMTLRTKEQSEEWLRDLGNWLSLAETYATQGYWPMNDRSCRMCAFRDVCAASPHVRENLLRSNFKKEEPLNPLEVR